MVKTIQASLTVLVSITIAAAIVITVFPAHARSDAGDRAAAPGIRHAVLVDYVGSPSADATAPTCPALGRDGSAGSCPYLAGLASQHGRTPHGVRDFNAVASGCPYLSAVAARTGCPALSTGTPGSACPFLSGESRPEASPRGSSDDRLPRALTL